MNRTAATLILALAALASFAVPACGNLVIPNNTSDDGGSDDPSVSAGDDVSTDARPTPNCDAGTDPVALACTGLYTDWTQLTLAPDVQAYQPGATLWTDGAASLRWIWLPPGQTIDTTDLNNWSFPVGTKIWQEFSLLGQRIETRYLEKQAASIWFRTTFAWSDDQSSAPAVTTGVPNARGLPYEIPPVSACEQCHDGENDFVLGFENRWAVDAPIERPQPPSPRPAKGAVEPPSGHTEHSRNGPTTLGALAFLHANCGTSCHDRIPTPRRAFCGLFLKLTVDATGALRRPSKRPIHGRPPTRCLAT